MENEDWIKKYQRKVMTAEVAMRNIKAGSHIFIGTGCGEPQALVRALALVLTHVIDAGIYHFLTLGATPHLVKALAHKFRFESFFINRGVRETIWEGEGDYIPIFLSEIPRQIATSRIPVDVALIQVTPPHENKNMLQVIHNSSYKITSKFEGGVYHISFPFVDE